MEDLGGLGGRRDAEHGAAAVGCRSSTARAQGGGLAGAGGSDDEDEAVVAGDGRGGVGLEDVEAVAVSTVVDGDGGLVVGVDGEQ